MFTDIINRLKKLFGIHSIKKSEIEQAEELGYVVRYDDVTEFNIVSIIANKLSNIVCSEVDAEVIPVSPPGSGSRDKRTTPLPPFQGGLDGRISFLDVCLKKCVPKLHLIAARAFGIGGVVLKPYLYNKEIYTEVIPQNRFFVVEQHGEIITKAGFIADVYYDDKAKIRYARIEYHSLGSDGVYKIENKAVVIGGTQTPVFPNGVRENIPFQKGTFYGKDGRITNGAPGASRPTSNGEVKLTETVWADIPARITISNVEQMLFAFVKCPADNRKDSSSAGSVYGVPITYGQDKIIKMILDLLNEIPDEYRNKKAFIGADDLLFDKNSRLPESGLYKLFRAGGSIDKQSFWEIFSPEIRHTSYFEGLDYLFGLLEKAVSVNKGMLTDLNVSNATATAIKRSTLDTFSTVDVMRKNIEEAVNRLVYAFGVIADAFDLCPKSKINSGEYAVKFDWNYRLMEDGAETWKQHLEGYNAGVVSREELRMYLFNEDRKTAKMLSKNISDDVGVGNDGELDEPESEKQSYVIVYDNNDDAIIADMKSLKMLPPCGNLDISGNPFEKDSWNMTKQSKIYRENPEIAKYLAAEAKQKL
jgi:hypothetical protein